MRAERLATLFVAAVLGCARTEIEDPRPTSVEPSSGYAGIPTPVVIRGDGFLARTTQTTGGGEATVDAQQRAWLGEVELKQVTWIDVHTLHAVVPAGLPQGLQPLVVENAYGRRGSLERAYDVVTSTGAMLSTDVEAGAVSVSVGQAVTVTATVTNFGTAVASGVTATATATSEDGAAASLTSGPSPPQVSSVGPGGSARFQWTYTALAAGNLRFDVSVTATDDFSGVQVGSAAHRNVTIELPASLTATIVASPVVADTGQPIALTFTVTNGGTATAHVLSVVPAVTPGSGATCGAVGPAPPLDVASGQAVAFTWTCTSGSAGSVTLGGTAHATDGNSGGPVDAIAIPAPVTVQTPAALSATLAVGGNPVTVSVGQALTMTLTVTDGGGAAATVTAVTPTVSPPGTAACGAIAPAVPQPLTGGQPRTFTWTCTPAVAGSLALGATVAGNDANTGAPLAAAASLDTPLTVQLPAALAATIAASRATASVGQALTVTLTVTNGGAAAANVLQVTPSVGGNAVASCGAVTPATPVVIPSGQATVFGWTCIPSAAGTLQLSAAVSGTDANSGAALGATPGTAAIVTVQTPAALAVTAFTANRTTANAGQAVGLTLTVTNTGGATANVSAVARTVSPSGATCTAASPAPPRAIAGGASQTFTWSCTATAAGIFTLGATVSATDANSGATANATATGIPITVQTPGALAVTAFTASRTTADVGQAIAVTLTLSNTGGASANVSAVTPTASPAATASCTAAAPAPPRTIAGGAIQTFTWSCTATAAGGYTLGATAAGTDANTGAALAATPTAIAVTVQTPAALAVTAFTATRTTANVGQAVALTLTLANTGGATANVSAVSGSETPAANSSCAAATPAPPRSIAGGASVTFTWTCTATAAGSYTLRASVSASDANSGAALNSAPAAISVTVQTPAALAATTFSASPTSATVGGAIAVTLTLANGGGAGANISAVAPSANPPSAATCAAASPAPPQVVAGAASLTFTWTCTAVAAGSATLQAVVSATDANTGGSVSPVLTGIPVTIAAVAPASAAVGTVREVTLVAADPLGDGTPAAFVNGYQGGAWIGPSRDGKRFVRLDPAKGSAASAELALGVDAGPSPASNVAWLASAPALTIGARGCSGATTACGPDDESGAALACAGEMGGREYLVLSGFGAAGSRYLYATTSGAGPLEAPWVDLRAALDGATAPALTAAVFASDRIYLGYARQGSGPLVLALVTPPLAGLDAGADRDVIDVGAPATGATAGVTALASVGGVLYVAQVGGIVRARTAAPASAAEWAPSTPTAVAWTAKTSVPSPADPGAPPRERALPALAAFGACGSGPCVFAARNVLGSGAQPPVVAQLWRCAPTAGPARCDPGDWALAAANASGDTLLTQLGDDANEAATVLVATQRWLYVGFDNGRTGVQLFRAAAVPAAVSDFKGRNGCAAGTPGCEGIGGNGFGDGTVTRIFDARVLTFGGSSSLWLTAGDGTGSVRVYRVED